MAMKRKTNHSGDLEETTVYDQCQTPAYGLDPILEYLNPDWRIWEPAAGKGNIVNTLTLAGYDIFGTDLLGGYDFFDYEPDNYDAVVTNPPWSKKKKYAFWWRCCELDKPFCLLMQYETGASQEGQDIILQYGIEQVVPYGRINFDMPNKGYEGTAQMPVAWFTRGLSIGTPITYGAMFTRRHDDQLPLFEYPAQQKQINQLTIIGD